MSEEATWTYDMICNGKSNIVEPLKELSDIEKLSDYFLKKGRYRENLFFIMGISFGLRNSDLLELKVSDVLTPTKRMKSSIEVKEKWRKNARTCYFNGAIERALNRYFSSIGTIDYDGYLFTKNDCAKGDNKLGGSYRFNIWAEKCFDNKIKVDSTLLRRTFVYHCIINSTDRKEAVKSLADILGYKIQTRLLEYACMTKRQAMFATPESILDLKGLDFCYSSGLTDTTPFDNYGIDKCSVEYY